MSGTFASVTKHKCKCGYLDREAADSDSPIEFDPELNEFNFKVISAAGQGAGFLRIYHCPFCGGLAPESKRASLFAPIAASEERRLRALIGTPASLDEVIARLGPPDSDTPDGVTVMQHEKNGQAPTAQSYRTLTYGALSSTADVDVIDYLKGRIHCTFRGKYVGANQDQSSTRKRSATNSTRPSPPKPRRSAVPRGRMPKRSTQKGRKR